MSQGVTVPEVPSIARKRHDDAMSTFSCQTGNYCSTAGDVIVFKVEPDGDDAQTIKTETNYTPSIGGQTGVTRNTQYSRPISQAPSVSGLSSSSAGTITPLSTFSTQTSGNDVASTETQSSAPTGVDTIGVNDNEHYNNYNILLRRVGEKPSHDITDPKTQTGTCLAIVKILFNNNF